MISITENNAAVYDFLEKSGNMLSDFSSDKVLLIEQDEDCCLVVFISETRNFYSFMALHALVKKDILIELLETVQDFSAPGFSESLHSRATDLIEHKLHSKNSSQFYFDAH